MFPLNVRLNCWSTTQFSIAISRIQFVLIRFSFLSYIFLLLSFLWAKALFFPSVLFDFDTNCRKRNATQHIASYTSLALAFYSCRSSPAPSLHFLSLSHSVSISALRLYLSYSWLLFRFGFYCSGCFHLSLLWTHKYFNLWYFRMLCMAIHYVFAASRLRTVFF